MVRTCRLRTLVWQGRDNSRGWIYRALLHQQLLQSESEGVDIPQRPERAEQRPISWHRITRKQLLVQPIKSDQEITSNPNALGRQTRELVSGAANCMIMVEQLPDRTTQCCAPTSKSTGRGMTHRVLIVSMQ
jgi:hypothetical protein